MKVSANGLELEVETEGRPEDPAVLLIMGLGAQLTRWPEAFRAALVRRGFYVIAFDNRDIGLSTKLDHLPAPGPLEVAQGLTAPPYALADMAKDAVGVLDALGVARAHVVGASMGGMIAQLVAAEHPDRTLSLVSIMSTTGDPSLPSATPEAMAVILSPLPPDADVDTLVELQVRNQTAIGSPSIDYGSPAQRGLLRRDILRSRSPAGLARQLAALVADGDRTERLRAIKAPAAVAHGALDPLVRPAAGEATARAIAGAELVMIEGMGHDFPDAAIETLADVVSRTAARAA